MSPPTSPARGPVVPPSGGRFDTLRALLPHLWPKGDTGLKIRVVVALLCLAVAKLATIYVPILFKQMVDTLGHAGATAIVLPIGLLAAYGLVRVTAQAFSELRDAIFAKVAQRAIRRVALQTFRHLQIGRAHV